MKTETLIIRISPTLKEQAKRQAEEDGKTLSEWLTDLIKIEIARKEGTV